MATPPVVSATLVADYDPDTLALTDGAAVTAWGDLAQTDPTFQPTYRASVGATGHAGVEFSGSGALFTDNFDQSRPWSALIVFTASATSNAYLFASHNNSFTGALKLSSGSLVLEGFGATVTDGTVSTGTPHVAIGKWTSADSWVQLDGANRATGAGIGRDRFDLKIGNEPSDFNRFGLSGTVHRVLFFNGALSDADAVDLDTWVQDTYGVTVADYAGGGGGTTYDAAGTTAATSATRAATTLLATAAGTVAAAAATSAAALLIAAAGGTIPAVSGTSGQATAVLSAAGTTAATASTSGAAEVVTGPATLDASGTVAATSGTTGEATATLRAGGTTAATSGTSGAATVVTGPATLDASGTTAVVSGTSGQALTTYVVSGTVAATSGSSGQAVATLAAGGTVTVVSGTSGAVAGEVVPHDVTATRLPDRHTVVRLPERHTATRLPERHTARRLP